MGFESLTQSLSLVDSATNAANRRIPLRLDSRVKCSPALESFSEPFWQTETREIITLLVELEELLERK